MDEKEYLTEEKYEEFKKEVAFLKTVQRKKIAENLEYAKSLGDLSENAEYSEAREMQASVESRISRLELLLRNAIIVSSHDVDRVTIGSIVTMNKIGAGDEVTYTIVGSEESDMSQMKISVKSPLGEAILGMKKNNEVSFATPSGKVSYLILDIK